MTLRSDQLASGLVSVTPSDSAFVDLVGVIVGGAGTVNLTDSLGNTTAVTAIAGQTINARIVKVMATGTTATALVGLKA